MGTDGQVLKLRAWRAFGWQSNRRFRTAIHHLCENTIFNTKQAASDYHQIRNMQKAVQKRMVGQCGPRVSQQKPATGKKAQATPFHHKEKNNFMQNHVDLLTNSFSLCWQCVPLYWLRACHVYYIYHHISILSGGFYFR